MAEQHEAHGHDEHGVGHVVPARYLIATCLGLLVLTIATVVAAKVDFAAYGLPDMNILIALAIAVVKASLVCLFFMHLFWDRPFHGFIIVASLIFVGIMISFAMTDTFEYRSEQQLYRIVDLKGGDSKAVQLKLQETQNQAAAAAAPPAEPGHTP
jgi:cytochrome c oxidase subunit 4